MRHFLGAVCFQSIRVWDVTRFSFVEVVPNVPSIAARLQLKKRCSRPSSGPPSESLSFLFLTSFCKVRIESTVGVPAVVVSTSGNKVGFTTLLNKRDRWTGTFIEPKSCHLKEPQNVA